ncbi:MAG: hypothetical protein IJZ53_07295 [Tyzzerella sp.]|nr:hypothetical protein [Tyzzerella sp.]
MSTLRVKFLSCLLSVALIVSMIPMMAVAESEAVTVQTEADLDAAIDAIPKNGSGEITIKDIYMSLQTGIYFEEKDIVFNLENAQLVTSEGPVLLALDSNVTINADETSSLEAMNSTGGMGTVRVDAGTYDPDSGQFTEIFNLTINGGKYSCAESDYTFAVGSGINVTLTDVVCNGTVQAVAAPGLDYTGTITINSGRFVNDVKDYVADGKFFCNVGDYCYVRDKEFSDDFSRVLTDGKIVFNYVKPSADDEASWLIAEDFCVANPEFYLDMESFNDDFSKCELGIYYGTAKEEFHTVDVVWNYDEAVKATADTFINKFPEDRDWFNVSDLELVNYWMNNDPSSESEVDSLANYSGELKSYLNNSNFLFTVEVRGGADAPFYTERIGSAKLIHDGKVYFADGCLGARAEHAIYVPESTGDTTAELIAAAQKRIDDYIGTGKVEIALNADTVENYYNGELAEYDRQLAEAQARLAAELQKPEQDRNPFVVMECNNDIEWIPQYKQYFIDSFKEGGDLYFLNKAAGGYFFNVEVNNETYLFVIIKDDSKLQTPTYTTVDLDTDVQVNSSSSEVPLDTLIEVDKLTEGTEYDRIIGILDVEDNETFDIKLHSGSLNEYVTKLENGQFEVKIPVPAKLEGKALKVYYVDENNKVVEYDVTTKDGYAVFTTDHFSIYTLATASTTGSGTGNGNSSSVPATGDGSNYLMWIVLAFISASYLMGTAIYCKKRK